MNLQLLNLDRNPERLESFVARNRHIVAHTRRVAAIDGIRADRSRLIANDVISAELHYTNGALGCALSHLVQWRDCIERNEPLTVIEDDAILCSNFLSEGQRLLDQLPEGWDYVMWGYNFDALLTFELLPGFSPCQSSFDQAALRKRSAMFGSAVVESRLFKLHAGFGTICYSISPRGAQRLLNFCMPLRPMSVAYPGYPRPFPNNGIDIMLARAWPHMEAYVAVPPLAVTDNDHAASTVQKDPVPEGARLMRSLAY